MFSITVVLVEELHFKLYMGLSQIDMNHVFKLADEALISWSIVYSKSSVELCKYQSTIVPRRNNLGCVECIRNTSPNTVPP